MQQVKRYKFDDLQPAFVIKNYIPLSNKVVILHKLYGKISCMYVKNHQASLLTTGSLIWCQVQKNNQMYRFLNLEIESSVLLPQLSFIHDLMKLCLTKVPADIMTLELFDYLWYVHTNREQLSNKGQMIVLLRFFLMLDLLPEEQEVYRVATLDPYGEISYDCGLLQSYISHCWDNFYQQTDF